MCLLPVQEKTYAKATRNGTFPEARLYGMMVGSMYVLPSSPPPINHDVHTTLQLADGSLFPCSYSLSPVLTDGFIGSVRLVPLSSITTYLDILLFLAPCVSGVLFGFSMILIYVSANSYIVDSYSAYAASAMAAKTLLRSEVGAMVPLFVNQMFHNMGFQYAGLLLALIAVAIAPIPFVFFKYGEGIRRRSTRTTQDFRKH